MKYQKQYDLAQALGITVANSPESPRVWNFTYSDGSDAGLLVVDSEEEAWDQAWDVNENFETAYSAVPDWYNDQEAALYECKKVAKEQRWSLLYHWTSEDTPVVQFVSTFPVNMHDWENHNLHIHVSASGNSEADALANLLYRFLTRETA